MDGLQRDERERNQAEVLEDLGVSREESNESQFIYDPDAYDPDAGNKMLISSAVGNSEMSLDVTSVIDSTLWSMSA